MYECPICGKSVREIHINRHIDSNCTEYADLPSPPPTQHGIAAHPSQAFFHTPAKATSTASQPHGSNASQEFKTIVTPLTGTKRDFSDGDPASNLLNGDSLERSAKKPRIAAAERVAPLAERMRPKTLDQVCGQELVGPNGIIRNLIATDRVPSMILWGGPGTGKTTIARLIAQTAGTRFVEINSTTSGVGECKKLFSDARNELSLTGRKTIVFCDEIHRFSKSQQDVFLGPVEAGTITLIGATTENPSFKVISALLSRCRVFTLSLLSEADILSILTRALVSESPSSSALALLTPSFLSYLAAFSAGDARTALNLLSLSLSLADTSGATQESLKSALTTTFVYDRAGDAHYDAISAFHKSVRGSSPDGALFWLARMLASGEDPLYIARRMVVIASEDIGLADNTMLPLATAGYSAAQTIGMPECAINLAHVATALAMAPKSTRAYRGWKAARAAVEETGVKGLGVPMHLRNAPTRLMKEGGWGKGYKYNPDYEGGKVKQDYLPAEIKERTFLGLADLGDQVDVEVEEDIEVTEDKTAEERQQDTDNYDYEAHGHDEVLLDPDGA